MTSVLEILLSDKVCLHFFLISKLFTAVEDGWENDLFPDMEKSVNIFLNKNTCGNTGFLFLNGKSHFVLAKYSSLSPHFNLEVLFLLYLYLKNEKALLRFSYLNKVSYANTERYIRLSSVI